MNLTSVPVLPGELVIWQGAVAVGPVRRATLLLHNVQLVLVIRVRAGLHHITVDVHCTREQGGQRLE